MFRTDLVDRLVTGTERFDRALRRRVENFRQDESGSLVIFGLFCFIVMLLLTGYTLDLMRYEERRTVQQNTADRAVLAAADLRQTLAPADVVKDYYIKNGLPAPADADIRIQQGSFNEWRTVSVRSNEQIPTWFMRMVGVNTLQAGAVSTAEERIGQVEISLVLDVSGSMSSNNKLVNLKPAAKAFIDTMFDTVEAGKLSVSIVPYSTQVSLGPDFIKYFADSGNVPGSTEQTSSSCLEFNTSDFQTPVISPKIGGYGAANSILDRVYKQNGHFDPFYTTNSIENSGLWNCPPDVSAAQNANNNRYMTVYSGDRAALKARIDALQADGNTSIDLGMKWGAGLLDPAMKPVVQSLIARGKAPASFGDRPYAYTNDEALKVIVLMTDGENTTQYKLTSDYDEGMSRLYANTTNYSLSGVNRYSLYDASRSGTYKYYSFYKGAWLDHPWGAIASDYSSDPNDSVVQMTWPQVWQAMSLSYFSNYIIKPLYGSTEANKWRAGYSPSYNSTYISNTQMDANALAMCSAAKNQKVKIFTIGFEASTAGQNLLRSCASAPANFYSVAGLDIRKAFSSIASSISKLRLTH